MEMQFNAYAIIVMLFVFHMGAYVLAFCSIPNVLPRITAIKNPVLCVIAFIVYFILLCGIIYIAVGNESIAFTSSFVKNHVEIICP